VAALEAGRDARSDEGIDSPVRQHSRERSARRRILEVNGRWQFDGYLFQPTRLLEPAADPMHVGRLHVEIVLEQGPRPNVGGEVIFGDTDPLALEVGRSLDAVGAHIDGGVAERSRQKGWYA